MSASAQLIAEIKRAHRSFATRIANIELASGLDTEGAPRAGDLCLAAVTRIGHHRSIELVTGRRVTLHVGDDLILAFGNRYATDQFEAVVPTSLGPCHLAAAGGIAASVLSRHTSTRVPTEIAPLGILRDSNGVRLNLERWGWPGVATSASVRPQQHVILVVGSGMNAGKTTTCANIIRTLNACGLKTSALKLTGTGSGGDLWKYLDAGAEEAMDFGNVGLASTAGMDVRALDAAISRLCAAVSPVSDIIVAEIADGILQRETRELLQFSAIRTRGCSVVLAVADPLAALAGTQILAGWGLEVAAVSGLICASPLAVRELREFGGKPIIFAEEGDPNAVVASLFTPAAPQQFVRNAS